MNRREMLSRMGKLALIALAMTVSAGEPLAQRPSRPIARPGLPLRPGRFSSGMTYGAGPGIFVVVSVDTRDNVVRLRDEERRTADVYVSPRLFDLTALAPGDTVAVDFFVAGDNDDRLEAASIDRLERSPN